MPLNTILRWIKVAVYVGLALLFVFLIMAKFVPGGQVSYEWSFDRANSFVRGPFPAARVVSESQGTAIVNEPVYFNVYSPRHFQRAEVQLVYSKMDDLPASFGLKVGNDNTWSYSMQPLPSTAGEFRTQTFMFDLGSANYTRNQLQFIVSSPGISSDSSSLLLRDGKFTFEN